MFLLIHSLICLHLDREEAFVATSWLGLVNINRTAQDVETKQRVIIRVWTRNPALFVTFWCLSRSCKFEPYLIKRKRKGESRSLLLLIRVLGTCQSFCCRSCIYWCKSYEITTNCSKKKHSIPFKKSTSTDTRLEAIDQKWSECFSCLEVLFFFKVYGKVRSDFEDGSKESTNWTFHTS